MHNCVILDKCIELVYEVFLEPNGCYGMKLACLSCKYVIFDATAYTNSWVVHYEEVLLFFVDFVIFDDEFFFLRPTDPASP